MLKSRFVPILFIIQFKIHSIKQPGDFKLNGEKLVY